jgi:hypothetical protein
MSAESLRNNTVVAINDMAERHKASLKEGVQLTLDQMRLFQGILRGLDLAIAELDEQYRNLR